MNSAKDDRFLVGTIVGIHGLRGDLKVRPLSGDSTALTGVEKVFFSNSSSDESQHSVQRASAHKGNILLRLTGIGDADAAQACVGREVYVARGDLAPLPDDEYYWYELEGMKVVDRLRGELGSLVDIFTTAAHDIYVVRGERGEILIPAVDAMVVAIDIEHNTMQVDLPEGLLADEAGHEV